VRWRTGGKKTVWSVSLLVRVCRREDPSDHPWKCPPIAVSKKSQVWCESVERRDMSFCAVEHVRMGLGYCIMWCEVTLPLLTLTPCQGSVPSRLWVSRAGDKASARGFYYSHHTAKSPQITEIRLIILTN
jgi:hypothetical protein